MNRIKSEQLQSAIGQYLKKRQFMVVMLALYEYYPIIARLFPHSPAAARVSVNFTDASV